MWRYIEGCDRQQFFLPDCVDDYLTEDSPVRIVDVFVDELDLAALGFRTDHSQSTFDPPAQFGVKPRWFIQLERNDFIDFLASPPTF